jgi:hypothetical protein
VAAPLLDMTTDNFRQQLARAKADVFKFMDDKCGLIKASNACRCSKKTKGFLQQGLLDGESILFKPEVVDSVTQYAHENNIKLDHLMEGKYLPFFLKSPYKDRNVVEKLVANLLFDKDIKNLFGLN